MAVVASNVLSLKAHVQPDVINEVSLMKHDLHIESVNNLSCNDFIVFQ